MLISEWCLVALVLAAPSDRIDQLLGQMYQAETITPVRLCSDDAFLRRVTLDLIGRIPNQAELRQFRRMPDRRQKITDLLASREFPRFWSTVWTAALIGYSTDAFGVSREPLRLWIEACLRDRVPFDEMVRQLISAEGDSAFDGPVNFLLRHREEPVVKVSRLFLGVRMDCARCHDHPFAAWTRDDFDHFARFFESMDFRELSENNFRLFELPQDAGEEDLPRFLTGARPRTSRWRDELALFITHCRPFARNYANRVWYQLLGRGIVDPPDDFSAGDSASPELLEFLAEHARATGFQLPDMIEAICNSHAYQRASGHARASALSHRLFASYVPKPLTVEQRVDSVVVAFHLQWSENERRQRIEAAVRPSLDSDFSQTWDYRETVQQLMSDLARDPPAGDGSITLLYERILCRVPTPRELEACRGRARSQIAFALLHSNEFRFNH